MNNPNVGEIHDGEEVREDVKKEALLEKMGESLHLKETDRERAAQILDAVEGMSIWEAGELLERCVGALQLLDITFIKKGRRRHPHKFFHLSIVF